MAVFDRHFTVGEANALLPELRSIFDEVRAEIDRLESEGGALAKSVAVIPTNGGGKRLEEFFHVGDAIRERLTRIVAMGVQVKDVRRGLLDFPSVRDGEEVLLCWLVEEPEVMFWHDLVTGFMGREPIGDPDRFSNHPPA